MYLQSTLLIVFIIGFLVASCSTSGENTPEVGAIDVVALANWDDVPMPELTEKETILFDSISKFEEYMECRKCNERLREKVIPYIAKLTKIDRDELMKNATDSIFISNFSTQMRSQLDIEEEVEAMTKADKDFTERIKTMELTSSVKIALSIALYK